MARKKFEKVIVVEDHGRNGKVVKKIVVGISNCVRKLSELVESWNRKAPRTK